MSSWILVPCLVQLRSEFNAIAPGRDRASDGSIGDSAHQSSQSDHNDDEVGNVPIRDADRTNEVHAIDVDVDLRTTGLSMETVVQFILARCRSGAERRLRYIIFNRRIWSAASQWRQQTYTGANPHDHHAHFSSSYTTNLEASTASWHLEDIPVALTADDKKWLSAEIAKQVKAVGADLAEALADDLGALPAKTAAAVWNKTRTSVQSPWSDTARNLLGAEITEAVKDGVAIERYPANRPKPQTA